MRTRTSLIAGYVLLWTKYFQCYTCNKKTVQKWTSWFGHILLIITSWILIFQNSTCLHKFLYYKQSSQSLILVAQRKPKFLWTTWFILLNECICGKWWRRRPESLQESSIPVYQVENQWPYPLIRIEFIQISAHYYWELTWELYLLNGKWLVFLSVVPPSTLRPRM